MIFIVIVILSLIASYLLLTSGILNPIKNTKNSIPFLEDDVVEPNIRAGMYGSRPSDQINVYDSKRPVELPLATNIDADLISNFQQFANNVYRDFSNNNNSVYYKHYVFYDYKIYFLYEQDGLSERQIGDYNRIRNTICFDIENKFSYYLDLIKYNQNKSYFNLRRSILNESGTTITFNYTDFDQIMNYILMGTNIPGEIIILLKYKLSIDAKSLLDDLISITGYNYFTALKILEVVLEKPPDFGMVIAGHSNANTVENNIIKPGIWTRLHHAFISNNINSRLLKLILSSYMTERISKSVLATVISSMKNVRISYAINDLIRLCKQSSFKIINTFPYHFTIMLLKDAIDDNMESIIKYGRVDVQNIDREYNIGSSIQNIEKYVNIYTKLPMALQTLSISNNRNIVVNMGTKNYYLFTEDYIINNYISFPKETINGLYLDIGINKPGSIIVYNKHPSDSITITALTIYGMLQQNKVATNKIPVEFAFMDRNIILDNNLIDIEFGSNTSNSSSSFEWTNMPTPLMNPTVLWKNGRPIVIDKNNGIKISAKSSSLTLYQYVHIFGIHITVRSHPVENYLQLVIQKDNNDQTSIQNINSYNITNIPRGYRDKISNFIFAINDDNIDDTNDRTVTTMTHHILPVLVTNTDYINFINFNKSSSGSNGLIPVNSTAMTISGLINSTDESLKSTGLIVDRHIELNSPFNFNNQKVYKIRIVNAKNNVQINKIVVFGDSYSSLSDATSASDTTASDYLSDNSILSINSQQLIRAYNMSSSNINQDLSYILNINNSRSITLFSNDSIYIQPKTNYDDNGNIVNINHNNRVVNMRAILIHFSNPLTINDDVKIEIINALEDDKKINYFSIPINNNNSTNYYLILLDFDATSAISSNISGFSILPNNFKEERFVSCI
jgi:hypothetical protein